MRPDTREIKTRTFGCSAVVAAAILLVVAGLWYFSTSRGSHHFVHLLEWSYPPIAPEACPKGDAIVVFAGTGPPRNQPLRSFETPNRMDGALALYKAGRAPSIVLTTVEGEMNRLIAIRRGVQADHIFLAGPARNTAAEARAIVAVAMRQNWRRILLVTSSFHMRRAVLLVHRAAAASDYDLSIAPYPVDWQQVPAQPKNTSPYMPNQYGIELFSRSVKELAGLLFYSF